MDIEKVAQIQDAVEQLRQMETRTADAPARERRGLNAASRQLTKQLTGMQQEVLEEYPAEYVTCRDLGHAWRIRRTEVVEGVLYRTLRCTKCPTERHEMFNKYGDLQRRSYKHAEGYLLPTAMTGYRYTKQFWRGLQYMIAAQDAANEK